MIILGVDSGATKTLSVIADESGNILGVGQGGPSNYQVVGIEKARDNLRDSITQAIEMSGIGQKFALGCFGIGGLDTKEDYELISKVIDSFGWSKRSVIVNDVVIAFNALTGGEPGIVVVAGTGSIAYGADAKGNETRSGGWGWLIGDEGSAFDIGRKALAKASRAYDGRGEDTILVKAFEEYFKVEKLMDIIPKVYRKDLDPSEIASLAKLVAKIAKEGDKVAKEIFNEAGEELAKAVVAVSKRIPINGRTIVGGSGGVFHSYELFKDSFQKSVRREMPSVVFGDPVKYPVEGALILGLRALNIPITQSLMRTIEKNLENELKK